MMTRPFIILLAGALLSAATANADRKTKRDRDRDDDDEEETTRSAKRSIGGEDRRRAARSIEEEDEDDDDRPKRKKKERVSQAPGETPDRDGAEAQAIVPTKLDDLIEVAVRHSPTLARAKLERSAAKGEAGAARIDQAWKLNARAQYSQYGIGGDVDVDLWTVVKEEKMDGTLGIGRKLPTGGSLALEVGFNRTGKEYAVTKEALNDLNGIKEGDPNG